MKRWHEDVHKMQKEAVMATEFWLGADLKQPRQPLGKFRKKHALDCGKKDCCICHYEKVYHRKNHKDYIADLRTKEQLNEANYEPPTSNV